MRGRRHGRRAYHRAGCDLRLPGDRRHRDQGAVERDQRSDHGRAGDRSTAPPAPLCRPAPPARRRDPRRRRQSSRGLPDAGLGRFHSALLPRDPALWRAELPGGAEDAGDAREPPAGLAGGPLAGAAQGDRSARSDAGAIEPAAGRSRSGANARPAGTGCIVAPLSHGIRGRGRDRLGRRGEGRAHER